MVATVEQLAELVRGRLVGDGSVSIRSARPVGEAGPGDITFIENDRFAKLLRTSPASAAIVGPHFQRRSSGRARTWRSSRSMTRSRPSSRSAPIWSAEAAALDRYSPQACVAPSAQIGEDVADLSLRVRRRGCGHRRRHDPASRRRDRRRLHARPGRASIHPNAVLYQNVILGDRVEIHAGTVLGGDGFGYRHVDGRHVKVPHSGRARGRRTTSRSGPTARSTAPRSRRPGSARGPRSTTW